MYFLAKELQILLCLYVKKVNQIISNCYFKDLCNATFDFLTYVKKGHFAYFYGYFIPPKIGLEKSVSKRTSTTLKKRGTWNRLEVNAVVVSRSTIFESIPTNHFDKPPFLRFVDYPTKNRQERVKKKTQTISYIYWILL